MEYVKTLPDPSIDRKKLHKPYDILFITIAPVICGANDREDIEAFGDLNYEWLKHMILNIFLMKIVVCKLKYFTSSINKQTTLAVIVTDNTKDTKRLSRTI